MPPHDRNLEDRPVGRSLQPLKALAPFIKPYYGTLALAMGALLVAGIAMLALPIAVRYVIDLGIAASDGSTVDRYFIILFCVTVTIGIFSALRFYLVTWLGERVVADIRDAVYKHILNMDPTFFEATKTGEVLSRLTTDTTLVQSIAGVGLSIALRSTLSLVGALIMLAVTSIKLMGLILVLVPLVLVPIILIGRKVRKLSRTAQDKVADASGLAGEVLNAMQTIQAFTLEKLQGERFSESVEATFDAAVRRIRVRALLTGIATLSIFGAITLVLWIGTHSVLAGDMTAGQLGQFLLYSLFVASSAAALSEMWGEIQRGAGAMERLIELLQAEPGIQAPENAIPLGTSDLGSISLRQVAFRYPSRPESLAISDFSLEVKPGETVAFVGPSGAGKSTLFQLLLRFYDPEAGSILVNDVDISQANPGDVRQLIGLVPQETVIFGTSAMENIRYGKPEASDEEIVAAAKAAEAHHFLEQLPQGYDTYLGERGTRLSGGQKQRIAIARAILKDPPILLLDEATSSLDAQSERLVQEALENLMQNRTTIIIAHRLATVLKADRIVVIDGGRIVDIGSHEELAQRDPLYARLAALQFGERKDESADDPQEPDLILEGSTGT
ncbi:MAG: ABC transporter transmembrane domain-containing protein [Gammaproteobacteria bacterium]